MADWDKRYRENFYDKNAGPHELLVRFSSAIPKGRVIDIAAGTGRDALFLAGKGYQVWALEKSSEAIKIARARSEASDCSINLVSADAEALPFRSNSAQAVTVFYFLLRSMMGQIVDLLKKDGILIYETYLKRQNMIDRHRNPDFLLDDGELLSFFSDLTLLFYEEIITNRDGKKRAIARYVGRKR